MLTRWAVAAALLGLLGGCGVMPGMAAPRTARTPLDSSGSSRLQASIRIVSPGKDSGPYRTMAIVNPYTSQDIDRLRFELWRVDPSGDVLHGTMETPGGSRADRTVDWSHLRKNTGYKLKVYALSQAGAILNESGIATVKEFATGNDDQLTTTVAIKLADRIFDGRLHPVVRAASIKASLVSHLKLELRENVNGAWLTQVVASTPAGSGMTKTIDFYHLKRNTSYRLVVSAIRTNGSTLKSRTVDCPIQTDDDITITVSL